MARRFWILIAFCATTVTLSALGQQAGGGAAPQKPTLPGPARDVVGAPQQNPQGPTGTGVLSGTVVYAGCPRSNRASARALPLMIKDGFRSPIFPPGNSC